MQTGIPMGPLLCGKPKVRQSKDGEVNKQRRVSYISLRKVRSMKLARYISFVL